jgi:Flp pilus assembly protein TadG
MLILSPATPQRSPRRAAALVEFAITASLFCVLIFGMIEFACMLMVQQVLVTAAREGARQATLPGATNTTVSTTVTNLLTASGVSGATQALSPSLTTNPAPGTAMTLTVNVTCANVAWFPTSTPIASYFNGKTLTATVVMIKQ